MPTMFVFARAVGRLLLTCALASVAATSALAQRTEDFPAAAASYLAAELPLMDAAIAARDRDYFEETMGRTVAFAELWGFKVRANPSLAPFQACTDAVQDYAIVGLCRLMPAGDECEPALTSRFATNLKRCQEQGASR